MESAMGDDMITEGMLDMFIFETDRVLACIQYGPHDYSRKFAGCRYPG